MDNIIKEMVNNSMESVGEKESSVMVLIFSFGKENFQMMNLLALEAGLQHVGLASLIVIQDTGKMVKDTAMVNKEIQKGK